MSSQTEFQSDFARKPLLYPAAVYGFRYWGMDVDIDWGSIYPKGVFGSYWTLPVKVAQCKRAGSGLPVGHAPSTECSCGIYAYFGVSGMVPTFKGDLFVFSGVIEGTGKTVIGPLGFKSQRARVLALSLHSKTNPDWWSTAGILIKSTITTIRKATADLAQRQESALQWLAEEWNVPVFDRPEKMVESFPLTDPERDFPGLLDPERTHDG
jgi:hypothetical protein